MNPISSDCHNEETSHCRRQADGEAKEMFSARPTRGLLQPWAWWPQRRQQVRRGLSYRHPRTKGRGGVDLGSGGARGAVRICRSRDMRKDCRMQAGGGAEHCRAGGCFIPSQPSHSLVSLPPVHSAAGPCGPG